MKKRVLVFSVLLILVVMPMIFADTTINLKTLKEHDVQLKVLDPYPKAGEGNLLEFFEGSTDADGAISFESYIKKAQINIAVIVEKDGVRKKINGETLTIFEKKATGGVINLEVKEKPPEPVIPEVNETESNETEEVNETTGGGEIDVQVKITEEPETEKTTQEIEEEKGGKITGAVINGTKAVFTSKVTYYIVGGIFILGVLFFAVFIVRKKLKSKRGGTYIDFKIRGDKKEEAKEMKYRDKQLEDAERKLQEAKAELDDIKNRKSKLQAARENFEKAKRELEKYER